MGECVGEFVKVWEDESEVCEGVGRWKVDV